MEGHAMVWEWPIWVYLFVAGVAGGGFFATFLVNQFTRGRSFQHECRQEISGNVQTKRKYNAHAYIE